MKKIVYYLIILLGLGGIYYKFVYLKSLPAKVAVIDKRDILFQAAKQLQQRFERGDIEGLFASGEVNCPLELKQSKIVGKNFYKCNPSYLECFLSNGLKGINPQIKIDDRIVQAKRVYDSAKRYGGVKKFHKVIAKSTLSGDFVPRYGIEVTLGFVNDDTNASFVFEDTCNTAYLPKRKYALGAYLGNENEFYWDNHDQDIFIDRYPVSYRDIVEWVDTTGYKLKQKLKYDSKKYGEYASKLTPKEMHDYCAFKSKRLMTAAIFDAASFYPSDLEDAFPDFVARSASFWTYDKSKSFIENRKKLKRDKKDLPLMTNKQCSQVYTFECQKLLPFASFTDESLSWVSLAHPQGGILEYLDNPLRHFRNLKASSMYLPSWHLWQGIGERVSWNKKGFNVYDIDWTQDEFDSGTGEDQTPEIEGELSIGFRCYEVKYARD